MGFHWRGDQLFTRSGKTEQASDWTSICLQLRDESVLEVPDYDHFSQFLGKAILFTVSLKEASFYLNDALVCRVEKQLNDGQTMPFSSFSSSDGLFRLKSIQKQSMRIILHQNYSSTPTNKTRSFFSNLWKLAQSHLTEDGRHEQELRQPGQYEMQLKLLSATASCHASGRFADEMIRSTKKRPFKQVTVQMIHGPASKHPILKHLSPSPVGKVYIGFETHQTSGLGAHIAGPFIPTVERESIDFVDGVLRAWNVQLLELIGHLSRIIYEARLEQIKSEIANIENATTHSSFVGKSKALLQIFNFSPSTPSPHLENIIFFAFNAPGSLRLPTKNLRFEPINHLRFIPSEMQIFMKECPQLMPELEEASRGLLKRLSAHSLPLASIDDVIAFELKRRVMPEDECVALLKWWLKEGAPKRQELLKSLKLPSPQLYLSQFTCFPNDQLHGIDWLPGDCVPEWLAGEFQASFWARIVGLSELGIVGWLDSLVKNSVQKEAIESDRERAEAILLVCSKHYSSLDDLSRARLASSLANCKCIPCGDGSLRLPRECFLPDVAEDGEGAMETVKIVKTTKRLNKDFLMAIGVQSHLPIEQVLAGDKQPIMLLRYSLKHRSTLSRQELSRIQQSAIFPAIDGKKFKLAELYSDEDEMTKLLNLPRLDWPGSLPKRESELGLFMQELGFNYVVNWRLLFSSLAGLSVDKRWSIFDYFFKHLHEFDEFSPERVEVPFLPDGSGEKLLYPGQLFLDRELSLLGFYLLNSRLTPLKYARVLGVTERPSSQLIAAQLAQSKLTPEEARTIFAYCARVSFTPADIKILNDSLFIPTSNGFKCPRQVFLPGDGEYAELFERVDFGADGNVFLRAIGVLMEPTGEHLMELLVEGAEGVFSALGAQKYLKLLEKLGNSWSRLGRTKVAKALLNSPSFIGVVSNEERESIEEEDDVLQAIQYKLLPLNDIFLIDDTIAQQIFALPAAPNQLSSFYELIGCRWISSLVKTEWRKNGRPSGQGALALKIQKLITERTSLILASLDPELQVNRRGRKRLQSAKVMQVDDIKIARTCSHPGAKCRENYQNCSAYLEGDCILVSARGEFDYFDLAGVMVQVLTERRGRLQDALLVASLLTTPLSSLRAKGFQISNSLEDDEKESEIGRIEKASQEVDRERVEKTSQFDSTKQNERTERIIPSIQSDQSEQLEKSLAKQIEEKHQSNTQESAHQELAHQESNQNRSVSPVQSLLGLIKKSTDSIVQKFKSSGELKQGIAGQGRDEESLQRALKAGIKSLRPHREEVIDVRINEEPVPLPPRDYERFSQEAGAYCAINTHLTLYTELSEGVRFYISNRISNTDSLFGSVNAALPSFYELIINRLGRRVFDIPANGTLCLFYDSESPAIAFNSNRSLFFNLAYFMANNHHLNTQSIKVQSFWFIVFCHELAHNFVGAHDAQHEYYMSSFLESYLPIFHQILTES